jgi:DNA-directed RNA polymerase subunit RPC12/RpoP
MSELLIKCSECKAIVGTGISMDYASFCTSEMENNEARCTTCESDLVWGKDDFLAISFCQKTSAATANTTKRSK